MSNEQILVEYSEGLRQAINSVLAGQVTRVSDSQRRAGRSALTDRRGGGGGGGVYEYNGAYKLILDGDRVRIVDGATYDYVNKTSDDMLVYVNQSKFYVPPFVSEAKTANATFALRFTSPTDEYGRDSGETPKVEVIDLSLEHNNTLPDDTAQFVWHRVGRLFVEQTEDGYRYSIAQDHLSGDIKLEWYMPCWGKEV